MKRILIALFAALAILSGCSKDDYIPGQPLWEEIDPNAKLAKFLNNSADYQTLVADCQKVIDNSQYMTAKFIKENDAYPNYEGLPVKLYEYTTSADVVTGEKKTGRVYMLNPSADKLATWIATGVWKAKSSLSLESMEKVLKNILGQSGAQFPVCGIVYEDMENSGMYPYLFKDGVTVYAADASKWATENASHAGNYSTTDAQLTYDCNITNDQLKSYTGRYARICSTTREQYTANGGTVAVGTSDSQETRSLKWLDVVRDLYKEAWTSSENKLITAWCKANL